MDVVYEDEHLLVVNKAAGMVIHPAPGNFTGTLVNALLHRYGLPGLQLSADVPALDDSSPQPTPFLGQRSINFKM